VLEVYSERLFWSRFSH